MAGLPRGETAGTASAFEPAGGNRFEKGGQNSTVIRHRQGAAMTTQWQLYTPTPAIQEKY